MQFRELVAYKLQRLQHINLLEARAHKTVGDSDRQESRLLPCAAHTAA